MIIQIRGTSGSGKSTVMRNVMARLPGMQERTPVYFEGRRQPLYYNIGKIAILGHYETPCGGCDTIGSAAQCYKEIVALQQIGFETILCEGLLLSEDVKWFSLLDDLHVVYLTTPLETCITQIKGRRAEAGNDKPLNTENTSRRVAIIERSRVKLLAAGKDCKRCSPKQAVDVILGWING